jgi:hypothetical protein
VSSSRDLPIQRLAIGICIAVVLLTGVAVGLFVHPYHAVAYEALVERSTAYAAAYLPTSQIHGLEATSINLTSLKGSVTLRRAARRR